MTVRTSGSTFWPAVCVAGSITRRSRCEVSVRLASKVSRRGAAHDLSLARPDGSYSTGLARLARGDVLILDDCGLATLTDIQRQDLPEVMEDRDATRSTIITSQLPRNQWHAYLGDLTRRRFAQAQVIDDQE
jgi:hypothetical protein